MKGVMIFGFRIIEVSQHQLDQTFLTEHSDERWFEWIQDYPFACQKQRFREVYKFIFEGVYFI